jgi:hypothetical protein
MRRPRWTPLPSSIASHFAMSLTDEVTLAAGACASGIRGGATGTH